MPKGDTMAMNCNSELNLTKLCAQCVNAQCVQLCQACADSISAKNLSAENAVANNICASGMIQAAQVWADKSYSNSVCSVNANFENACISNLTLGSNIIQNVKYKATANYNSNVTYNLGSFLTFNNIIDDPNNNISLSPNSQYKAPVDGYYMLTLKVNSSNIQSTAGAILGVPVANPEIYVNGLLVRELFLPFLSFFSEQKSLISSLITLKSGDIVQMKYNVLQSSGLPVAGTVDIAGGAGEDGNSLFKIIFLSSLGSASSQSPCAQCPTVIIPCSKFVNPCMPCVSGGVSFDLGTRQANAQPLPCDSCQ